MVNAFYHRLHFIFLFVILISSLSIAGFAISMQATAGFDGIVCPGVWNPVFVTLSNPTEDTVEGTLYMNQRGMRFSQCSAQVNLPPHSHKLYTIYTKFNSYGSRPSVVLANRNNIAKSLEMRPNFTSADEILIVSIGDRASRPNYLSGETVKIQPPPGSPGGSRNTSVQVGSLPQSNLPDRPTAYQGVDYLVAQDLDPASASPKTLQAIAMWVTSGGTLIVPACSDYHRLMTPFYEDLLPVEVNGVTNVNGLNSLTKFGGIPFPAGPVSVTAGSVKPNVGYVMASDSGVPIVAARKYGAGRVVYLAFDPAASPCRDWNGITNFWKTIITEPKSSLIIDLNADDPNGYGNYDYALHNTLQQNNSVRMPSFSTISFFLLAYLIVLAPVNYFFLRRKHRLELAWVTTPIIIIIFTATAYAIGYTSMGGRLLFREIKIVECSTNARYASTISAASLFSPARKSYDVETSDPFAICESKESEMEEFLPSSIVNDKLIFQNVRMAMWSNRYFDASSGMDLGGPVSCDLTQTATALRGSITMHGNISLHHCAIIQGRNGLTVPDLKPGKTINVNLITNRNNVGVFSTNKLDEKLWQVAILRVQYFKIPCLVALEDSKPTFGVSSTAGKKENATVYIVRLDCHK